MQISNIVKANVNSSQRNLLCQVCAVCLSAPLPYCACTCFLFSPVCTSVCMAAGAGAASSLQHIDWSCTWVHLGVCLQAILLCICTESLLTGPTFTCPPPPEQLHCHKQNGLDHSFMVDHSDLLWSLAAWHRDHQLQVVGRAQWEEKVEDLDEEV